MMYSQVKQWIVQPTLAHLDREIPYSREAEELLLMTCAHESKGGMYIHQVGGPALGIYQMEPKTARDIWENYLLFRDELSYLVADLLPVRGRCGRETDLTDCLSYATAMARVHYFRVEEAIPRRMKYTDEMSWLVDLANYAKKYYNTPAGKATAMKYLDDYLEWAAE